MNKIINFHIKISVSIIINTKLYIGMHNTYCRLIDINAKIPIIVSVSTSSVFYFLVLIVLELVTLFIYKFRLQQQWLLLISLTYMILHYVT